MTQFSSSFVKTISVLLSTLRAIVNGGVESYSLEQTKQNRKIIKSAINEIRNGNHQDFTVETTLYDEEGNEVEVRVMMR